MPGMRRREFVSLFGGAAAWPLAARAQQPAMPVIGFLNGQSPDTFASRGRRVPGRTERNRLCKWAERFDRCRWAEDPTTNAAMAGELVRRQVAVIAATGHRPRRMPRRPQRRRSRFSSSLESTPSSSAWSPASIGRQQYRRRKSIHHALSAKRLELLGNVARTHLDCVSVKSRQFPGRVQVISFQSAARAIGVRIEI